MKRSTMALIARALRVAPALGEGLAWTLTLAMIGQAVTILTPIVLQSVIDDLYARFLAVVERGRPGLAPDTVRRLADGRVYSAQQAKDAGLVDGLGYLPDALDELKRQAGLREARVVAYHRPRELRENLYSASARPAPRASLAAALRRPAFLYLWWPSP